MIKLKNDRLEVEIDNMGAQLTHVIGNESGYDYIWNGDAWKKHAPILFPAIGKSNNDEYVVDSKTYRMPNMDLHEILIGRKLIKQKIE